MKKAMALALALLMVLAMGSGALADALEDILAAGKITVATSPDYAPYEFLDPTKTGQEQIVGSEVEMMKYIAEKLGVELVIEMMDFSATIGAVTSGAVDVAMSGLSWTEDRAEAVELSSYYNIDDKDGQGILIRKADAELFKVAEDFTGKTVAAQNGALQYNLLVEYLPNAVAEPVTNLNDAVLRLLSGKVDAISVDYDNGLGYVGSYPELMMSEFVYDYSGEGIVLAAKKGETALIEKLNEIIAEVNELGLFSQWTADAVTLSESFALDEEAAAE
ncbi:MAG: transporter substrate-binding domain-containing protein [Oscillospiraceae bacterium]|jgi:polar amino acid transport system substrate-binding protein|nr:transporter substrate-binding domain-containing protein [Oscillospiraceae bacterium]